MSAAARWVVLDGEPDGSSWDELCEAAGIELGEDVRLPEPGEYGTDVQTLMQLYWPMRPSTTRRMGLGEERGA